MTKTKVTLLTLAFLLSGFLASASLFASDTYQYRYWDGKAQRYYHVHLTITGNRAEVQTCSTGADQKGCVWERNAVKEITDDGNTIIYYGTRSNKNTEYHIVEANNGMFLKINGQGKGYFYEKVN
ncbi:MAG: hypothetical protein KDK39_19275 [Leptospiraceae bacterium]|nr:hypothetical protein [Leptospiraceae bacterium]